MGLGLGYVYVGRIKLAIALVVCVVGLVAIAGWSRLVFYPLALYILAGLMAVAGLLVVAHTVLIARRDRATVVRRYNRWWFYLLWVVASWVVSELVISSRPVLFGFEPLQVPASSMAPLVERGDYVMADTWYFDHASPQYGDLIVFRVPNNIEIKYLKRIIGLPGDSIEIREDVLIRNGQVVNEPYFRLTDQGSERGRNFGPVTTPPGSYFVLGDNRHRSKDSRYLGPIDQGLLHGLVVHRWFAFHDSVRWERFPERFDRDDEGR